MGGPHGGGGWGGGVHPAEKNRAAAEKNRAATEKNRAAETKRTAAAKIAANERAENTQKFTENLKQLATADRAVAAERVERESNQVITMIVRLFSTYTTRTAAIQLFDIIYAIDVFLCLFQFWCTLCNYNIYI